MNNHSNHLINETSPYLLQHAHNPVNWYPWGEEALTKARREDKPILVSIGYGACHWCHVMEKESFEDEATAKFMNEHFVNIKIDREERPDLDHIYMDAVQAMTGSGGWPLNVFLTPATKPFYGGTYFPPVKAFNRASWMEVLAGVAQAYRDKREEIESQADNLTTHLIQSNGFGLQTPGEPNTVFSMANAGAITVNCLKTADQEWGGFGKAPKFPQSFTIRYLLRYYHVKKKENPHQEVNDAQQGLDQALLSLDKMIAGGIYDQLGGGFARYSTDTEWLAPHFEKMLYDNALMVDVLSEAYQLTGKSRYAEVIHETMDFIKRELMHPQNGFYAALDADSEGEEGKFYVWQKAEVDELLGKDADVFCKYYDISEKGNWFEPGTNPGSVPGREFESELASGHRPRVKNILRVNTPWEEFATQQQLKPEEMERILSNGKNILLGYRNKRVRPALDDKIILGWNALMNKACSKAYGATGKEEYLQLAIANMEFLWKNLAGKVAGEFYHTWKNGQAKYPAFLDDYAFLADALLHLQEATGNTSWLMKATEVTEYAIEHFSEPDTGFFFYTRKGQEDIIVRKKEVYDGALPSGNAVMATNLYKLGILLDKPEWRERSDSMMGSLGQAVIRYPTSFGYWAAQLLERTAGTVELAIVGRENAEIHRELLRFFIPHRVLMVFPGGDSTFPLLAGKEVAGPVEIFVCKDFACLQPVTSAEAVMSLINRAGDKN